MLTSEASKNFLKKKDNFLGKLPPFDNSKDQEDEINDLFNNYTNLVDRINKYFEIKQKPSYFIRKYKDKGYVVKLPISTNPKYKYFFFRPKHDN